MLQQGQQCKPEAKDHLAELSLMQKLKSLPNFRHKSDCASQASHAISLTLVSKAQDLLREMQIDKLHEHEKPNKSHPAADSLNRNDEYQLFMAY